MPAIAFHYSTLRWFSCWYVYYVITTFHYAILRHCRDTLLLRCLPPHARLATLSATATRRLHWRLAEVTPPPPLMVGSGGAAVIPPRFRYAMIHIVDATGFTAILSKVYMIGQQRMPCHSCCHIGISCHTCYATADTPLRYCHDIALIRCHTLALPHTYYATWYIHYYDMPLLLILLYTLFSHIIIYYYFSLLQWSTHYWLLPQNILYIHMPSSLPSPFASHWDYHYRYIFSSAASCLPLLPQP